MNLQEQLQLTNVHYNFLFDIRRSMRYHERRRAFFERIQHIVRFLTILMAGVVVMDVAKEGNTAEWMVWIGVTAAIFSIFDLVIDCSSQVALHANLREKFASLEIDIVTGPAKGEIWLDYQKKRLLIEKDEPAIYYVIDGLCRNELLIADGFSKKDDSKHFYKPNFWHRLTAQFFRWEDAVSF